MKENGLVLKKARRRYPEENITDDQMLLANTFTQAESLLHSQKLTARGISLWF